MESVLLSPAAYALLGLVFALFALASSLRSGNGRRRIADAIPRKRILVGPSVLPPSSAPRPPQPAARPRPPESPYTRVPDRAPTSFEIPGPAKPVNRQLTYDSPVPKVHSGLARQSPWTPDNRRSGPETPLSWRAAGARGTADQWTPEPRAGGSWDAWASSIKPKFDSRLAEDLYGQTPERPAPAPAPTYTPALPDPAPPPAPAAPSPSLAAVPAPLGPAPDAPTPAPAPLPPPPSQFKRTRMDELKADGILRRQSVADTVQPERGSLSRPQTPTAAPASPSEDRKRKRPSNAYGLDDEEDRPVRVPRPRGTYSRSPGRRGPKVTYMLSRRTVTEEAIEGRPGKKRRTVEEVYESPEVVLFELPPGLAGMPVRDVEMEEDLAVEEVREVVPAREPPAEDPIEARRREMVPVPVPQDQLLKARSEKFLAMLAELDDEPMNSATTVTEAAGPAQPKKSALQEEIERGTKELWDKQGRAMVDELRRKEAAQMERAELARPSPLPAAGASGIAVPAPVLTTAPLSPKEQEPKGPLFSTPAKPAAPAFSFGTPGSEAPAPADKPAVPPLFSFGKPAEPAKPADAAEQPKPAAPAVLFGNPPAPAITTPASEPPKLSFGAPTAEAPKAADKPTFSFNAPAASGDKPSFSFGAKPDGGAAPAFSFGAPKPAEAPAAAPAFAFGAKPAEATAAPTAPTTTTAAPAGPTFQFNAPAKADAAPAISTAPVFSFAAPKTDLAASTAAPATSTAAPSVPQFTFGGSTPAADKPALPAFGASTGSATGSAPAFTFGGSASGSAAPSAPPSAPATPPLFGQPVTTSAPATTASAPSVPAFTFGAGSGAPAATAAPAAPSFVFSPASSVGSQAPGFGQKTEAPAATSAPAFSFGGAPSGGFGQPATTAAPSAPAFTFGAPATTQPASGFGSQPAAAPATGFGASTGGFGSAAPAGGTGFGFGAQPAATQAPGFGFGQTAAPTQPATAFGQPAAAAPAFGGGGGFGSANAGTGFGFGGQPNPAQPGFGFGSSTAAPAPAAQPPSQPSFTFGGPATFGGAPVQNGFGSSTNTATAPGSPAPGGFGFNGPAAPGGMFQFGGGAPPANAAMPVFNIGAGAPDGRKIAAPKKRLGNRPK
ncbi:hypothetical protein DFJ74DRAFT_763101 [Hyaloraphidium curvatum]|nr:hypothetical protein DFJ74DRAFT_763101 [Hyaloraphidium curvatum]